MDLLQTELTSSDVMQHCFSHRWSVYKILHFNKNIRTNLSSVQLCCSALRLQYEVVWTRVFDIELEIDFAHSDTMSTNPNSHF